jgi:hypothetical protein
MIIRHDRSEKESVIKENTWPGVTTFFRGHGAATLIAPTWLLTAAHVARDIPPPAEHPLSIELAGNRYRIARVVMHPAYRHAWVEEEEGNSDTVDLAAVELETPVSDVVPYALYDRFDERGQEVLLLGWGESGNGLRGALSIDRSLRQATNIIDETDDYWLKFRFDAPPAGTRLEGVCGRGDSGGPAFIRQDERLLLAGVSSWQEDNDRGLGLYGCVEHYARVSTHLEWIRETCEL